MNNRSEKCDQCIDAFAESVNFFEKQGKVFFGSLFRSNCSKIPNILAKLATANNFEGHWMENASFYEATLP